MSVKGHTRKDTGEVAERRARDFYATPEWPTHRLLDAIGHELDRRDLLTRWVEPAVGDGAIVRAVDAWIARNLNRPNAPWIEWTGVDIHNTPGRPEHVRFVLCSWLTTLLSGFAVAITNPPFEVEHQGEVIDGGLAFVEKMLAQADVAIMLHRADWLTSAKRNEWVRANPCDVYLIPDRISFTKNGKADAQTYAFFVWGLTEGGHHHVLATTPIDERREGQTMAPKKATKATKAPKRGAFDPKIVKDAETAGGGALERARETAKQGLASEREAKAPKSKGAKAEPKSALAEHLPAVDKLVDDVAKTILDIIDPARTPVPVLSDDENEVSAKNAKERVAQRLVKSYPRLFKLTLDGPARQKANTKIAILTDRIDGLKERSKREQKFVAAELSGYDAIVARARDDESMLRKKRLAGLIGVLKAEMRSELDAAANGYRWIEVECEDRADDHALKIFAYRLDTNELIHARNMTESEIKDAERRRQLAMRYAD